jgi:hypothetical protein
MGSDCGLLPAGVLRRLISAALLVLPLALGTSTLSYAQVGLPCGTPFSPPCPPPPPPTFNLQTINSTKGADIFDPHSFQLRFGAFAHDGASWLGKESSFSAERSTYDLNPEIVFPRLLFGLNLDQWWSVLIPRLHLGGLINLEGRTSAVYVGGLWTIPLPHRFFAEFFLDGDKHDGYLVNPPPGRSGLGCPYLFHVGGSLGYKVSEHWSVMLTFDHQSNGHAIFGTECGGTGPNTPNTGINDYGLRLGYSF